MVVTALARTEYRGVHAAAVSGRAEIQERGDEVFMTAVDGKPKSSDPVRRRGRRHVGPSSDERESDVHAAASRSRQQRCLAVRCRRSLELCSLIKQPLHGAKMTMLGCDPQRRCAVCGHCIDRFATAMTQQVMHEINVPVETRNMQQCPLPRRRFELPVNKLPVAPVL
ncbi:hypothetical protein P43SY_010924 [Pythium insidiosum]|uniref:Uncharacterized protein n=1 Tax=Pythium insidiosum TaxID=114742 RepID=A0AAD5Q468_PYTIN|nr:hypothetical protein P43SY_010924 [Pythium insidiosum]